MNTNSAIFSDIVEIISATYSVDSDRLSGEGCHDKYEIVYFTHGSGKYNVEGREYSFNVGDAMLIAPMTFHRIFADSDSHVNLYSVKFSLDSLSESMASILLSMLGDDNKEKLFARSGAVDHIFSVIERSELADGMADTERCEYLKALLCEMIVFLSSADGVATQLAEDELGARVVRYLNRNIDRNVSLDKLARRFFVSKYYLCRAFKKYSGTSVHSYINHKRITYAKQLIDSGETASGAAYKVGFGDYSAFYRAYVRIIGKSPTN